MELSGWGQAGVDSRRAGWGSGGENSAAGEGVARTLVWFVKEGRKEGRKNNNNGYL